VIEQEGGKGDGEKGRRGPEGTAKATKCAREHEKRVERRKPPRVSHKRGKQARGKTPQNEKDGAKKKEDKQAKRKIQEKPPKSKERKNIANGKQAQATRNGQLHRHTREQASQKGKRGAGSDEGNVDAADSKQSHATGKRTGRRQKRESEKPRAGSKRLNKTGESNISETEATAECHQQAYGECKTAAKTENAKRGEKAPRQGQKEARR